MKKFQEACAEKSVRPNKQLKADPAAPLITYPAPALPFAVPKKLHALPSLSPAPMHVNPNTMQQAVYS